VRRAAAALSLLAVAGAAACRRDADPCGGGARVALRAPDEPVGFDATFAVEARPLCAAGRGGTIAWRARDFSGQSVALSVGDGGRAARGRTPTLAASVGAPLPWGVVPLSPRTRGEVIVEATWRDGGAEERHEAHVFSAPRARGLPNTPVGARVYLGGEGWRLDARPPGGSAALEATAGAASLVPDRAGDYHLVDGAGHALTLRAGRYDETPLDCGRAGCHAAVANAAARSPMTSVLARGLPPSSDGHAAFGPGYPGCALACHATGEPGLRDGGFVNVMDELGLPAGDLGPRAWEALPTPLRRLGGVGCLACHGPGALPEATSRWSVLRADVCATCHDAPARYGHVAAWRASRMARADRDPRAASDRACARCHTTWGFLARLGASAPAIDRRPPAGVDVGPIGVACAACHAVHAPGAHGGDVGLALLRAVPRPALLAGAAVPAPAPKSEVCLACHAPEASDGTPAASAAALWLGRGGLDPASGGPLPGSAPNATAAGGCIGCHRSGPAVEHGAGHGFVASKIAVDDLGPRARSLWTALRGRLRLPLPEGDQPPHALGSSIDRSEPLGRAAWDVALVLEDPAAAAHNAPYARQLLAAAERALNGGSP
jgi:hypothetical protein